MTMRNAKGLTLIEIVLVVGIMALLFALAIPSLARARMEAEDTQTKAELRVLYDAVTYYFNDYDKYPISFSELEPYLVDVTRYENKYEININANN